MNEFQKAQNAKILSCYNTDEALSELTKSEILDIEKGGKRAMIGEKRTFAGREYIKTADGWKFHGKGTGTKAQEHAAGAIAKVEEKPEEKVESTSLPKVDDIYAHPESGKKYRVRAVNKETGKIKYKQEGSELTQETDIKKFTEILKPASESPKAEEAESTDSHNAAEIKKKALEIMRAKGGKDIKLSDFTIRQAKQVIKEHEMLGSKEAPKTEKKVSSLTEHKISDENKKIILSELESEPSQCSKAQLKTISKLLSNIFTNWGADVPSSNRDFKIQASSFDKETPAPLNGKMEGTIELTLKKISRERIFSIDLPYTGVISRAGFSTNLLSEKVEGAKGIENFLEKYPKLANEVKKSLLQTIDYSLKEIKDSSEGRRDPRDVFGVKMNRDILRAMGLYTSEATSILEILKN